MSSDADKRSNKLKHPDFSRAQRQLLDNLAYAFVDESGRIVEQSLRFVELFGLGSSHGSKTEGQSQRSQDPMGSQGSKDPMGTERLQQTKVVERSEGSCDGVPQSPELLAAMERVVREADAECAQLLYMERDGEPLHVLLQSQRVAAETPELSGFLLVCTSLNHLPALDAQMVRNDKLATAGKIAAGVAHEIRNPLTSLKGFAQILHAQFQSEQKERELTYMDMMLAEVERVNLLINELLLLSRPAVLAVESVRIERVIQEMAAVLHSDALLHGVDLTLSLLETPPARIDVSMFKQVVLNLFRNALEAMEGSGTLTVSTCFDDVEQKVRMDVADGGPGIPNYMVDRIFDAFYTTKESGIGLGLPVCQRIVANLGGEIRVHSKGFGSTFSVFFPTAGECAQ